MIYLGFALSSMDVSPLCRRLFEQGGVLRPKPLAVFDGVARATLNVEFVAPALDLLSRQVIIPDREHTSARAAYDVSDRVADVEPDRDKEVDAERRHTLYKVARRIGRVSHRIKCPPQRILSEDEWVEETGIGPDFWVCPQ
jgi:hypothetical protein